MICPLTTWEVALRQKAGQAGYEGSFVEHWLQSILYYSAPNWVFVLGYSLFGALVIASWFLVRPMKTKNEFVANLSDVFERFGHIEAKPMFGGYGIYHDGLMFALVADDVLYLKVDERSVGDFKALDLPPFEFEKKGKKMQMSYYTAPEQIFDDPDEAKEWADRAYSAALRARK